MTTIEAVEAGRDAIRRRAWEEALETFTNLDHEGALSPQDLELLADAAWWAGMPDDAVNALERAYQGYLDGGMVEDAARAASLLSYLAARRLAFSVAYGWGAKARRLLEGLPDSPVQANLRMLDVAGAVANGTDVEHGIEVADEALEVARRTGNRDAEAEILAFKGNALTRAGRWEEGLAVIDEAAASALSGGLSLRSASHVYCITMSTCIDLADFARATEWTDEAERWMDRHAVGGYPGACDLHHAELKRRKGAWPEAEEEARQACDKLRRYRILDPVGHAYHEIGMIRLRMGDQAGAEEAFRNAYENGSDAQPGMALLMLARGRAAEASIALAKLLGVPGGGSVDRALAARLLPAQVEAAIAAGDTDVARSAVDQLDHLAGELARPAFEAAAAQARGELALHEGDPTTAVASLEKALRTWRNLEFPYESARTRVLLGRARLVTGDEGLARIELDAAGDTFERLGAEPDRALVEEIVRGLERAPHRERVTRTFMFTDIVTSTDLVGLIGDEAWESLLAWHDRELRAVFAAHGGVVVNHTGDGFFVAFDDAARAVEAAVAVQRRLADHRRQHGFAPAVRIGVHATEATVDEGDFRGQGVHVAARIAAAAGAEEILVSTETVDVLDSLAYPVSDGRPFELKGIKAPVELRSVDWR
jgi:class 3 adenylate cyclase